MLPLFRRKLVEPIWAIKSRSPLTKYWKELEKNQYLSEDVLRNRQWIKLKAMIEYVYHNNQFYRNSFETHAITPDDIQCVDDIRKIPILTKEDIRNNYDNIVSQGYDKSALLLSKTGGSTGTALELFKTEECSELKNAAARRSDRWSGWEVGEPVGALWGNPERPKDIKSWLRHFLLSPYIYLDTVNLNEGAVLNFASQWNKMRPTLLFGHSHSLFLFANYISKLKINTIKPKTIISTSMMLIPHERAYIEKVFGVRIFDRYGCEEVSLIASECERHEGLHINIEHLFVEFIKPGGTYAKHGEEGSIVITDLLNKAMPFIRYRVEDLGVPSDRKCSCGRGLPLMERVVGRVADFLVRQDGGLVAGISLIEKTLTAIPGILQMQIIQETIDNITLNIVTQHSFPDTDKHKLLSALHKALGANVNLHLVHLNRIHQEKSGKYRFSICRIKSPIINS